MVRAVVVLRDGREPGDALARELQEHVKERTAPYKYPRIVEFADALPKTASGKIKRAELARRVASNLMANRLAGETSPYLLQHKDNPVDWYPWGEEALARAREEDRPILLSIGYSACHWCHVMERESFEDEETAAADERALRPDQARPRGAARPRRDLHGGLPGDDGPRRLAAQRLPHPRAGALLRRHLLPARGPRGGMPSWRQVLEAVAEAWDEREDEIRSGSDRIVRRLPGAARSSSRRRSRSDAAPARRGRRAACAPSYDPVHGGFGGAPKFPPASAIEFLLRRGETRDERSHPARDGLRRDVRPGGRRLRPLLGRRALARPPLREDALRQRAAGPRLPARLAGHGRPLFRRVCEETLDWALREMRARRGRLLLGARRRLGGRGGQVLRLDAWRSCAKVVGDEAAQLVRRRPSGATSRAATSSSAARRTTPTSWTSGARRLYERAGRARLARARRQAPDLVERADDLRAGRGGRGRSERADYLDAARDLRRVRAARPARRRRPAAAHAARTARPKLNAYLEDHAFLLEALLTLYEASFEPRWFGEARAIADTMIERFADEEHGGFFETSVDHERLVARRKDLEDHPIPSGNSSAAYGLLRLGGPDRRARVREARGRRSSGCSTRSRPGTRRPSPTCSRRSTSTSPLPARSRSWARTRRPRARGARALPPAPRAGRRRGRRRAPARGPRAAWTGARAAYVCEHFACKAPVTEPERARGAAALSAARGRPWPASRC